MYYCVRCGDKIDKDECVCDKCGLKFRIVTESGTTVYINRVTSPEQADGNIVADVKPAQPVKAEEKPKKKRKGWLIALLCILGTTTVTAIVGFIVIGLLFVGGVFLLFDDSVEVESADADGNYAEVSSPSVYQNETAEQTNEFFGSVLRDPYVTLKGDGTDTATIMVYMNGSSLESEYGYATGDLKEMLSSTLNDNVNVIIQTGGTKEWKSKGISNTHSQRFKISDGKLMLLDDSLPQLDITQEETLEDFINYCTTNYPADRNILVLWNHGGGVVYGYGLDEISGGEYDALTIDEIQTATRNSGIKFEAICFDACLMGGLECACALSDVADYMVASEDFEYGDGWQYQNWLSLLGYNSSTPFPDLAKVMVDDFIHDSNSEDSNGVLCLVDLRYARLLYSSWTAFAYENKDALLANNYGMQMQKTNRAPERIFKDTKRGFFDWFDSDDTMETYCYAVDLMALASTLDTDSAKALESAVKSAILYCSTTKNDAYMTGLSVTLPYGDQEFYDMLVDVFTKAGFDNEYIEFLADFVGVESDEYFDWNDYGFDGWFEDSDCYDCYDWQDYDWDSYCDDDYCWDTYDYDYDWSWYYDDVQYYDDYDNCYEGCYDDDWDDDDWDDDDWDDDDWF